MRDDSKRRLLQPGTYRVTANIVIEAELTEEQLRSLFVQERASSVSANGAVPEPLSEEAAEEEEFRARLRASVQELVSVYERKLGPGPENLSAALGSWLNEFEPAVISEVISEVASARISRGARFAFLKERLRVRRIERARNPGRRSL